MFVGDGSFGGINYYYGKVDVGGSTMPRDIHFNANDGTTEDNPMAGHATGDEVRPYAFSSIPLIAI